MSRRSSGSPFAARPSLTVRAADAWVRASDASAAPEPSYTARLTIDVTPALRGRIKITAFERGITVAEMLRTLLEREFGEAADGAGAAP